MVPKPRLLVVLALSLGVLLAVVWWVPPDARATRQVEDGLKRALATYAAARALNAVISVAQGTEVALEPGGVGVVLTPGQALDPINDLVEQFSTLMLLASVSFGVQRVLIAIGGHTVVSALLSLAALAWTAWRWRGMPRPWLTRLLVVLLLVRFAVPLAALGSDLAFRTFLARDYAEAQVQLGGSAERLGPSATDPPVVPRPDESFLDRLKRLGSSAAQSTDVGARIEALRRQASAAVDHLVTLTVIFLLQTLVLPLALLWGLLALGRAFAASLRGHR